MLIEDHAGIQKAAANLLRAKGHEVSAYTSGTEAIQALEAGARPSVIVLDICLPGIDGIGFRRQQLANPSLASIPVIIASGSDYEQQTLTDLDALAYLRKPYDPDDLMRIVAVHDPVKRPR